MSSRGRGGKSLIRFFSNPAVGIVGSLASVAGIFLAIYFYLDSKVAPELIYFVEPARAVVAEPGRLSRVRVRFDEKTVETGVTAVQIAFWNHGKQTIRKDDVLEPFVITTEHGEPILDATVRKASREVVGLELRQDSLAQGRLIVSWNILERDDGGVVQLIYAGGPGNRVRAEGVIEGQREIRRLEYPKEIKSAFDQYFLEFRTNRLFQLKLFAVSIVAVIAYLVLSSIFNRKRIYWYWEFFMMVIFVVQIFIWLFILSQPSGPPFGF